MAGFVSSALDPFLNHLFARGPLRQRDPEEVLAGRPGFVWLDQPADSVTAVPAGARLAVTQGMTAAIGSAHGESPVPAEIVEVRSAADLDAWHEVYSEVLAADPRSRSEWRRLHTALGRAGDGSLALLLARVDGFAAASGAVFFDRGETSRLACDAVRTSGLRPGRVPGRARDADAPVRSPPLVPG